MKQKLILGIMIGFLTIVNMAPVFAQQDKGSSILKQFGFLTVVSEVRDASILINGREYMQSKVYNVELSPGTHYVEVKSNKGEVIYSEFITLVSGQSMALDTRHKVSDLAKPVQEEAIKTIRQRRGTLGVGAQLQSVSGFGIKKFFGPMGIQVSGLIGSQTESTLENSEKLYQDDNNFNINVRWVYNIAERLRSNGRLMYFYSGVGFGIDTFDDIDIDLLSNNYYYNTRKYVPHVFAGVEFDHGLGSYSLGIEYRIQYMTRDVETTTYNWGKGYESVYETNEKSTISGLVLNVAYHWYF
ncbi:hypothetical protein CL647_01735 [bacterium]|nr:hypothetical protein [bacterium]|tara:strand:- start:11211 stop:12107 length:897 start_codon:yes stop_codon:yes gene_type:complete